VNHRDPRQGARVTATESFEEEATGIPDEATRIADGRYGNGDRKRSFKEEAIGFAEEAIGIRDRGRPSTPILRLAVPAGTAN
jgi:hypothetical protein